MPAQYLNSWSPSVVVAAHTALLAVIDAAAAAASVTIHDLSDTLLATVPLTDPAGTVDGATGELPLTPDGRDESAAATGLASYATLRDGDGNALASLPCIDGTVAVCGYCVLDTLNIEQGGPVEIAAFVVSPGVC